MKTVILPDQSQHRFKTLGEVREFCTAHLKEHPNDILIMFNDKGTFRLFHWENDGLAEE